MAKASLTDINDILNFYWSTNTMYTIKESWSEQLSHAELISCCRQSNDINETLVNIEIAITKKTFDGTKDKIKNGDTIFISNSESSNTAEENSSVYEDSSSSSQTSKTELSVDHLANGKNDERVSWLEKRKNATEENTDEDEDENKKDSTEDDNDNTEDDNDNTEDDNDNTEDDDTEDEDTEDDDDTEDEDDDDYDQYEGREHEIED
jgi:hypothetical protein